MSRTLVLFAALVCGCGPSSSGAAPVAVSVHHLTRDQLTARDHVGRRVSLSLDRGSYTVEGRRIAVAGTVPHSPPLILIYCRDTVPDSRTGLLIEGRVLGIHPDGVWRTSRADFAVAVTDALARAR